MAIKTIETITDDIDGTEGAKHVAFSFEGVQYTIDLSEQNKAKLREALDLYIEHATKVSAASGPRRPGGRSTSGVVSDAKAIRAWAEQNNVDVPARGRIPGAVVEQWKATQG